MKSSESKPPKRFVALHSFAAKNPAALEKTGISRRIGGSYRSLQAMGKKAFDGQEKSRE
jgi:hypothetical protein